MCGKIELMDGTYSETFTRNLKEYFNICVPKIQAKFQNQISFTKIYLEEERARNLSLLRKSSTAVILRNLPFD